VCAEVAARVVHLLLASGPWATQTLADLGADVIKVERPLQGDDTRSWGPPFIKARVNASCRGAFLLPTRWQMLSSSAVPPPPPPPKQDKDGNDTKQSAYFLSANRGKRAITCDITQPEGQAVLVAKPLTHAYVVYFMFYLIIMFVHGHALASSSSNNWPSSAMWWWRTTRWEDSPSTVSITHR
jgi:hypothetical protein